MSYLLWDTDSGNVVDSFTSENDALEEVRVTVKEFGHAFAATLALSGRDSSGHRFVVAAGQELIDRAMSLAA